MSVYFGYTVSQASAYYRMIGFIKEMEKQKLQTCHHLPWHPQKYNGLNRQLETMMGDEKQREEVCQQFEFLNDKKKVELYVFQYFASVWGLALMDLIHTRYKAPILTEIDDWAFGVDSSNPNYKSFTPGTPVHAIIQKQCRESDGMIVTTEYLKSLYSHCNNNIHVIPNGIDMKRWDLKNNTKKSYVTIGWEGADAHTHDQEVLLPVIQEITRKYGKKVRFKFVGGEMSPEIMKIPGIMVVPQWVPVDEYPASKANHGFDIELAPLRDTQFNRGKSNLRYLEAGALKIPTVASDIGPYKSITGLKCSTTEDWIQALSTLIEREDVRKVKGLEAYRDVKENFNLKKIAKQYSDVINLELEEHQRRLSRVNTTEFIRE
jgi:glycosyltransferase involved in cell wall biosynthesis